MEEGRVIMIDRIYMGEDDQWYYRARGNTSVGPFDNRQLAEQALTKRIRSWSGRTNPRAAWPQELRPSKIFRRSAARHP